jgi:hypothetical protein
MYVKRDGSHYRGAGSASIRAPGGLIVKQRVGVRRDPVELLAFRVADLEAAVAYYQQVGLLLTLALSHVEVVSESQLEGAQSRLRG